jgi:hypothetical protein
MKSKWESIGKGSEHPAKEMIKKSSQNILLLKKIVKDYNKQEKDDYIRMIVNESSMAPEVEIFIAGQSEHWGVWVARNTESSKVLQEIFKLWPKYPSREFVGHILKNENCPDEIFKEVLNTPTLFKDEDVQKRLVLSRKITEEDLAKIAKFAANKTILTRIVVKASTPPETLDIIARHPLASNIVFKRMFRMHKDDLLPKTLKYIAEKDAALAPYVDGVLKKLLAKQGGPEKIKKDIAQVEAEIKKLEDVMEQNPDLAKNMTAALTNKKAKLLALKAMLDELNIVKEERKK